MDTSTVIALTGSFLKFVGETLADLKARQIAQIDVDLLRLKRSKLSEALEDFKSKLPTAVTQEKARVEQDMISRGLANTTIRTSTLQAVERDANDRVETATREYNRAIEEIALLERRVTELTRCPWWKRLLGCS
jgi:phage-related minor tail protein